MFEVGYTKTNNKSHQSLHMTNERYLQITVIKICEIIQSVTGMSEPFHLQFNDFQLVPCSGFDFTNVTQISATLVPVGPVLIRGGHSVVPFKLSR